MSAKTKRRKKNLTDSERTGIMCTLLQCAGGSAKVSRADIESVALAYACSSKTIMRVWKRGRDTMARSPDLLDVRSKIKGKKGKERIDVGAVQEKMEAAPYRKRYTLRSLACVTGASASTLCRMRKRNDIVATTNAIKPLLTGENRRARMAFIVRFVNEATLLYSPMYDVIHLDEKWFYMTRASQRIYLSPNEPPPLRQCKSKRFIGKIMFLAAVARPRKDATKNSWFDGKLGIWPFVERKAAQRTSKNRPTGTIETKPVTAVTRAEYIAMLLDNVLPAIAAKFPRRSHRDVIYLQQDNAKPHVKEDDPLVSEVGRQLRLDLRVLCQPPNSPDFNVLDLSYFRPIQTLQHEEAPSSYDELIAAVEMSFSDLKIEKLDDVFLSLQSCMTAALADDGGNAYELPHSKKATLRRNGELPRSLSCPQSLFEKARSSSAKKSK